MRFSLILFLSLCVAVAHGAPVSEEKVEVTTVVSVNESSKEEVTEVPKEEVSATETTGAAESVRDGRQLEDEDEEEGEREEEDDDDEDEDEDEEEEEEEERKLAASNKAGIKPALKKKPAVGKPVPVLGEGVEDDEAEDLGIFEREDAKSDEKASDEEKSEEEQKDEDDEDDSGEDEDRDDPSGSTGLIAEPVSSERGDVDETVIPIAAQSEVGEPEQPLAIAVVQPEETSDPVVPILVEETSPESSKVDKDVDAPSRKNSPKKQDDDDEDDDEEDEDEDEEEAARSEKQVNRARSAYSSPVLYYYPFPESPVKPEGAY